MTTVAIISEYNPFHTGHKYQIDRIREEFGADAVIISLMSGNFTQRGEIAIMDKWTRAKAAVECGVDLCLELPFPYSMSAADIFARSAVSILNSLGTVDYLSFGSESGDISELERIADVMLSEDYEKELARLLESPNYKSKGYPTLCELALDAQSGGSGSTRLTPNNILGIEYIKALKRSSSSIKPHTIKREGAAYDAERISDIGHQSATAIRSIMMSDPYSALDYLPNEAFLTVSEAIKAGGCPTDAERLSASVITSLRLNSSISDGHLPDGQDGLYNRLRAKSFEANSIHDLVRLCETKKHTDAKLRRCVWYSLLGVTSSELKECPRFTQLLAADRLGTDELKRIKKESDFPILTKPSATDALGEEAMRQKKKADSADSIYQLTKPLPPKGSYDMTSTPYVKR
ncbi:MAG: nucleotidyltransferase family protein [Clostridia bacterium]|nr:nucleotidyltransferase family protein [Clostridia bacterium]